MDGFALVSAKGGPKLEKALPDRRAGIAVVNDGTGHTKMRLTNVSVSTLASALGRRLGDPVADKTGIQGEYDMVLDYENDADVSPSLPSVLKAVQEQLGLKLEKQKVTVEMLVIDHVERIPTENQLRERQKPAGARRKTPAGWPARKVLRRPIEVLLHC
jgi:uncharacterized protein (TIGR03435 family)